MSEQNETPSTGLTVRQVAESVQSVLVRAEAFTVASEDDRTEAVVLLQDIATVRKHIEQTAGKVRKSAYAAYKDSLAYERSLDDPLEKASGIIKKRVLAWDSEQQRLREEEERRLREEARKLEEEERLRLAQEAEEDGASEEMVEEILTQPVRVPYPIPSLPEPRAPSPKVKGVASTTTYGFRIVNPSAVPREYWCIDEQKIGRVVRAMRGQITIPGVEVTVESGLRIGARN